MLMESTPTDSLLYPHYRFNANGDYQIYPHYKFDVNGDSMLMEILNSIHIIESTLMDLKICSH